MSETKKLWKAIKEHCLECAGETPKEVTLCQAIDCRLWTYRFGCHPKSSRYADRMAAAKENFVNDFAEMKKDGVDVTLFVGSDAEYLDNLDKLNKEENEKNETSQDQEESEDVSC